MIVLLNSEMCFNVLWWIIKWLCNKIWVMKKYNFIFIVKWIEKNNNVLYDSFNVDYLLNLKNKI